MGDDSKYGIAKYEVQGLDEIWLEEPDKLVEMLDKWVEHRREIINETDYKEMTDREQRHILNAVDYAVLLYMEQLGAFDEPKQGHKEIVIADWKDLDLLPDNTPDEIKRNIRKVLMQRESVGVAKKQKAAPGKECGLSRSHAPILPESA